MAVDDIQFQNNASTTITDNPLLVGATTINISDGAAVPAVTTPEYAFATLQDATGAYEIVKITAHVASATSMTVERGADNSTAAEWANGTLIEMRPNAAIFEAFRDHNHDTEYADLDKVVEGSYVHASLTSSGTDAYALDLSTSPGTYTAGLAISFVADTANTGACSLDVNSLGVKAIKMQGGNDPTDGYIANGSTVRVVYDGTNFMLTSPSAEQVEETATQTLTNKTLTSPTVNTATINTATIDDATLTNFSGGALVQGTQVDVTSQSAATFSGIPSWVKEITISFIDVDPNGSVVDMLLELGDSGGLETTGYNSACNKLVAAPAITHVTSTTNFIIADNIQSTSSVCGNILLTLNDSNNRWSLSGLLFNTGAETHLSAGSKQLSGTLTQLEITMGVGGFTSGYINVLYKG